MKLLFVITLAGVLIGNNGDKRKNRRFPEEFLFGASTASYQIEGGWNADDKGVNIWDHLTHNNPSVIKDCSNGDITSDSYNNYKRDVEMMRELGLNAYRFSLSWSRILPNGLSNKISKAGINYYNNLINEMLKYNITPVVALYHWDLPQKLQDLGGFMNHLLPEWFEDYARIAFKNFGDRVKHWITFNEPREICYGGYGNNQKAPMLNITDIGTYVCAKNLVMANARAYRAYTKDFKTNNGGVCGIIINVNWIGPLTDTNGDRYAAEIRRQAEWGIYAEPIFSKVGGFPKELSDIVANKSAEQGYKTSRLPQFTDEEGKFVTGTADFFGANLYSSFLTSAMQYRVQNPVPSLDDDTEFGKYVTLPEWPQGASVWLVLAPNTIYNSLTHIKEKYNNPVIYITENGWSSQPDEGLIDNDRIRYYREMLEDVLDCLEAGVNLKGYFAWTLMDNFEWEQGHTERFGLYQVDFDSSSKTRTPRKSAFVYKDIIKKRLIDLDYEPCNLTMSIDDGK